MKILPLVLMCVVAFAKAQTNSEIHLYNYTAKGLTNPKKITTNNGYNNQPYFMSNSVIMYAGTTNGQTDIIIYNNDTTKVFNYQTAGSEYSPQPIPTGRGISAVRLDNNGLQRLYSYTNRGQGTELLKGTKVAYYLWADAATIISANISNDSLLLHSQNIITNTSHNYNITTGRSFHKIPKSSLISFIDTSNEQWIIKSLDPQTHKIKPIANTLAQQEDLCWLPDGSLLTTLNKTIYRYDFTQKKWISWHSFEKDKEINAISRLASSPNGRRIAVVIHKN